MTTSRIKALQEKIKQQQMADEAKKQNNSQFSAEDAKGVIRKGKVDNLKTQLFGLQNAILTAPQLTNYLEKHPEVKTAVKEDSKNPEVFNEALRAHYQLHFRTRGVQASATQELEEHENEHEKFLIIVQGKDIQQAKLEISKMKHEAIQVITMQQRLNTVAETLGVEKSATVTPPEEMIDLVALQQQANELLDVLRVKANTRGYVPQNDQNLTETLTVLQNVCGLLMNDEASAQAAVQVYFEEFGLDSPAEKNHHSTGHSLR